MMMTSSTAAPMSVTINRAAPRPQEASVLSELEALEVPPGTPGVYISLFPSGEVKIGFSSDIAARHRADSFRGVKLVAAAPGGRAVEADLHARFRHLRSREVGEEFFQEMYHATDELTALILRVRKEQQNWDGAYLPWTGIHHVLSFDDGQQLKLEFTYLHVIETGDVVPRYQLWRLCPWCSKGKNSLEFLNAFSTGAFGWGQTEYLVLDSSRVCSSCMPAVFPARFAFVEGQTRIRLGRLFDAVDQEVFGYDRDSRRWMPLRSFGVRRMAKAPRSGHANDVSTLRLQPSIARKGRAQGRVTKGA